MLFFAILFVFIGAAVSFFVYNHNYKLTSITFEDFLNNPLHLFSQIHNKNDLNEVDKNSNINNKNFHPILTVNQNKDKNFLPNAEDYEDNQLFTTLDFNTEIKKNESNQFSLNSLVKDLPIIKSTNNLKIKKNNENEKIFETVKSTYLKENSEEPLIEPKHLLMLQVTNKKICLFEMGTSEAEQSR